MIGNLMSRMADAEKLSVDQLQMALQNGTLPPYVGIPLLQDKVKQAQMMQTAQAGQQTQPEQPPIAEQVMAQAQGLDQMPSNLPTEEQAYAAGGIVAFAEGDLVEDDEVETEDSRQEASLLSLMAAARDKIKSRLGAAAPQYVPSFLQRSPASTAPATPQVSAATPNIAPVEGGVLGLINTAAKQENLPADLLRRISGAESSNNPNAANPRSSAKGIFQFTDSTWRSMGGKPGEQFNPEANVGLGAKYLRQNAEHLKKTLGRDPNYHEVYAAHMFGPGVAKMLNKANPKDPIERGLATFQSPQMVKKIMKANPNLRNKSVGEVLDNLQIKTGPGIVSLASGGIIAFSNGGSAPTKEEIEEAKKPFIGYRTGKRQPSTAKETSLSEFLFPSYPIDTPVEATPEERALSEQMYVQDMEGSRLKEPTVGVSPAQAASIPGVPPQAGLQAAPQVSTPEVTDPYLEKYMDMLQKRETASEKAKDIDTYMALMQAGLGMMASKSPYALGGIGEGGMQGLASYAATQKQRAAEEAATLTGYGRVYNAKQAADLRRDLNIQNKELAMNKLRSDRELKLTGQLSAREKQLETAAYNNIIKSIGTSFTDMSPEQKTAALNAETQRLKATDPILKRFYEELELSPVEATVTAKPLTAEEYSKMYGLTPKK
jgi:soluble lytic murein transglycosylase-like protein